LIISPLSAPLNDPDQKKNNRYDQDDMNKPAHRVTAHQPQQPENYEYDRYGPQHVILLSDDVFPLPLLLPAGGIPSHWY
jgi:hypothetical protein